MTRFKYILTALVLVGCLLSGAFAQEGTESQGEMPPMGPPEEMKQLDFLIGDWDIVGQIRMDPAAEWTDYTATGTYSFVVGGGAIQMVYESEMMGMPMHGMLLQTFNRETGKWQAVWVDNLASNITYMEGDRADGKTIMTGTGQWQGIKYLSRVTTYNETETSFDWKIEDSMDDGQTWAESINAKYTKRQ